MAQLIFITHPEVIIDPDTPVERWGLRADGIVRMRAFARSAAVARVEAVWASTEAKAIESAGILAGWLGQGVAVAPDLGENDRSATGYLPEDEFSATADAFFAAPTQSVRGWERAIDAQARIVAAVERIAGAHGAGDLAICAHGAVGTLLWCHYARAPISRAADQPFAGHYWCADLAARQPDGGWRPIAPRS